MMCLRVKCLLCVGFKIAWMHTTLERARRLSSSKLRFMKLAGGLNIWGTKNFDYLNDVHTSK